MLIFPKRELQQWRHLMGIIDMKDIAIYGAGGFGKEVACLISQINEVRHQWNLIGFFDDAKEKGLQVSHYGKVLGGMKEINEHSDDLALAIAVGNPNSLRGIRERIINDKIFFPNIIAPEFGMSDPETFIIGEGNIIGHGCAVSCDVAIGNYNILNADIVIGHDVKLGDYNVLMPDIRISGEATIGDENLIGVGSIVLQQVKVGNRVHLGAGSVLMTKPKDGGTYLGNPAKLFKF